jgi:hypothetical protein
VNDLGEAALSTQPVTLHITVNIIPQRLHNKPRIPTKDDNSPTGIATIPGRVQFPTPERLLPLPQSREEMSPTGSKDPGFALHQTDEAMNLIAPIDGSKTWERAVGRIKWVMDTLSPIAEVRIIPF